MYSPAMFALRFSRFSQSKYRNLGLNQQEAVELMFVFPVKSYLLLFHQLFQNEIMAQIKNKQ